MGTKKLHPNQKKLLFAYSYYIKSLVSNFHTREGVIILLNKRIVIKSGNVMVNKDVIKDKQIITDLSRHWNWIDTILKNNEYNIIDSLTLNHIRTRNLIKFNERFSEHEINNFETIFGDQQWNITVF